MGRRFLLLALVAVLQTRIYLTHTAPNYQNGNTFFGFQFQPFQASFSGSASYNQPNSETTTTTTALPDTSTAGYYDYSDTYSARSAFNLADAFGSALENFSIRIDEVNENITQGFERLAQEVQDRFEAVIKYAEILTNNLEALIQNNAYRALSGSFRVLKVVLEQSNQYAKTAQKTANQVEQNFATQLDLVNNALVKDIADWSTVILDRLGKRTDNNQWAQTEANALINDLSTRYGALQASCVQESSGTIESYQKDIQESLTKLESIHDKVLDGVRSCVNGNINSYVDRRNCVITINGLVRELRLSQYEFRNLYVDGIKLNSPINAYAKSRCATQNNQELQLEKFTIEIKIDLIRGQAADHPNPTSNQGSGQDSGNQDSGSSNGQNSGSQGSGSNNDQNSGSQGSGSNNDQNSGSQGSGSNNDQNSGSQGSGQDSGNQDSGSSNGQNSGSQDSGNQDSGSNNGQNSGSQGSGSNNDQNSGSQGSGSNNDQNSGSQDSGNQDSGSNNGQNSGSQGSGQDSGNQDSGSNNGQNTGSSSNDNQNTSSGNSNT